MYQRVPKSATAHYRTVLGEQKRTVAAGKRLWASVPPAAVREVWAERIPAAVAVLDRGQRAAAVDALLTFPGMIGEQGDWEAPTRFPNVEAFHGVSSDRRPLASLLRGPAITADTLMRDGMAPAEAMRRGGAQLAMILKSEIADAGRGAASVMVAARPNAGYVRMLNPPSCPRCSILAGRFYRWNQGFLRHPRCDCIHVPAVGDSKRPGKHEGLLHDPYEYFHSLTEGEQARIFGAANAQAIRDGADIFQVVNARRGMSHAGARTTTEGLGKHGYAARLDPRLRRYGRLTPEGVYEIAGGDREKALVLLERMGYILPGGQNPLGSLRGQREGFGQLGHGGAYTGGKVASILEARRTGVRDPANPYTMTAAERRVWRAEQDWLDVLQGRNPYTTAAAERRGGPRIGGTDKPLTPEIAAEVERRYLEALTTGGQIFTR